MNKAKMVNMFLRRGGGDRVAVGIRNRKSTTLRTFVIDNQTGEPQKGFGDRGRKF